MTDVTVSFGGQDIVINMGDSAEAVRQAGIAQAAAATAETERLAAEAARDDTDAALVLAQNARPVEALQLGHQGFTQVDSSNRLLVGIDPAAGLVGPGLPTEDRRRTFSFATSGLAINSHELDEVIHLLPIWGQSWALGSTYDPADSPSTTTAVDPGYALMFNSGPWPYKMVNTGFADLVSKTVILSGNNSFETIGPGMAAQILVGFTAAGLSKPRLLPFVAAEGGTRYEQIKRGSRTYIELIDLLREAKQIAWRDYGKRVAVPGLMILLGESDAQDVSGGGGDGTGITAEEVERQMTQLWHDLTADIATVLGPQPLPLRLFPWVPRPALVSIGGQTFPETAIGYSRLRRLPFVVPVGPQYAHKEDAAGNTHLAAAGYRTAGQMFGATVLSTIWGNPEDCPIYAIKAWRSAADKFRVRFSRPVAIATDNPNSHGASLGAGKGFAFYENESTTIAVTGVALVTGPNANLADTVEITLASTPTAYSGSIVIAGTTDGTLIRSAASYGTSLVDGTTPLYHWAPTDKLDLAL